MDAGYLYLNVGGRWPGFAWRGLELGEDGALRLARVPLLDPPAPALADLPAPDGPAGVAVAADGTVYWTDPAGDRLLRRDPCDGSLSPVPCFTAGGRPAQLRAPRGLLLQPRRGALVVADSGNHRLQLLDPASGQLLGVWGERGAGPGQFDTPWALAADAAGNVYVAEGGNRRVQKLTAEGEAVASFWENASAAGLDLPAGLAVAEEGEPGTEVFVLDAGAARIAVLDEAGRLRRWLDLPDGAGAPLGLAFAGGSLYVGDNAGRRLLRLLPDGTAIGEAEGFEGPVAALAAASADTPAGLWLHPGGGAAPVRLAAAGGRVKSGVLWGGPFGSGARPVLWHEIQVLGGPLAPGAHLQLFARTGPTPGPGAPPPAAPADDPLEPFGGDWTPLPAGALRGLVRGVPAEHLWVGAHLAGEGRQTPAVTQVSADFDTETWSRHLPAIYRREAQDPELLERVLALFASLFDDVGDAVPLLSRLFDPQAAPADWLPWLAGWLGVALDEAWPEEEKRRAVAGAFAAAARRGTPGGLAEAVRFATGVDVRIAEPVLAGTWWALPGEGETPAPGGRLGRDTVLAPAQLGGAVAGTTAVLDGSYLAGEEGLGTHLYETVAHQFCVQVYERHAASERRLAEVRAVVEREKPAHTAWHLCVIRPTLRVGFQARLGIDTVVGGPTPARRLGRGAAPVLGGRPPDRLGEASRVGAVRLGAAVFEGR